MFSLTQPFTQFFDASGAPLSGGSIFIGNESTNPAIASNQIPVYWDEMGTQPAAQPIKTLNGYIVRNGSVAKVFVNSAYSMAVYDKSMRLVFYSASASEGSVFDLSANDGAGLIGGFESYSDLRTYRGNMSRVQVIGFGISGDFYLDPSDTTSPDNGGTVIIDVLGRRWKRQFEGGLDLYWFGAKGNYVDDDSDAIGLWLAAYVNGKNSLASSRGVFRHTRSFDFPDSVVIRGSGAPAIQHFPQLGGDKSLLRPGYKHLISGSTFIFSGTADKSFVTARTDRFSSGIYVWRYPHKGTAPDIEGVGFILDCDVLDASGSMTTAATDNRAVADYLFVRQDTGGALRNCTIFGYTRNYAYVRSNLAGDTLVSYDADYMKSVGCKISGGMATIGNQTGVAGTSGFTGGRCIDCDIQGGDHHNRPDGDFTRGAYYVDGYLSSTARIRGHMIIGGSLRTYANDAVITDNVNDFIVDDVTLEFPALAGVPGADTVGGFVGTVQTLKATMIAGASTDGARMLEYLTQVTGPVKQVGFGSFDSMTVAFSGNAVRLSSLASGAQIQFTNNAASSTSGFVIRRDAATGDLRFIQDNVDNQRFASVGGQMQLGLTPGSNRNIVSGVVTIGTNSNYRINGTSPSGTDVNSLDGGTYDGQIVALSTATAANPVTIKKSTSGNLRIPSDCVLSSPFSTIVLKFNGTYWTEQSRAIYV